MTGTYPLGWAVGDIVTGAQLGKSIGAISDTTLGGSAASVDITGIVGTYAHLFVVVYARGDTAAAFTPLVVRFNGDSGTNYDYQVLQGQAAAVSSAEVFAASSGVAGAIPANTAGANLFSAHMGLMPNYAGTANNKAFYSVTSLKTATTTGTLTNVFEGVFWRSNAAVTRITLFPSAGNLVAGTRVTLYGMG